MYAIHQNLGTCDFFCWNNRKERSHSFSQRVQHVRHVFYFSRPKESNLNRRMDKSILGQLFSNVLQRLIFIHLINLLQKDSMFKSQASKQVTSSQLTPSILSRRHENGQIAFSSRDTMINHIETQNTEGLN